VPTDEVITQAAKEVSKVFRGKVSIGAAAREIRLTGGDKPYPAARTLLKELLVGPETGIFIKKVKDNHWEFQLIGSHFLKIEGEVLKSLYQHEWRP
jgi:hypothetical protein